MLHKLVSIEDNERIIRLTQIVNELIEFVCHPENPFSHDDTIEIDRRITECCTDSLVAKWITNGNRGELKAVSRYLSKNPEQREKLRTVFQHDLTYCDHIDDKNFTFEFSQLDSELKNLISGLMVQLYEALGGEGFPQYIMGDGMPFNLGDYVTIWEEKNPTLKVCPACDGKQPDKLRGRRLSDLDHFLPKSIYPLLALHPKNLVPICTECNRWVKKNTDPLDYQGTVSLKNTFHPYVLPAAVDMIVVSHHRSSSGEMQVKLEENAPLQSARIISLNNVFGLEERWTGRTASVKALFDRDLGGWRHLKERYNLSADMEVELKHQIKFIYARITIGEQQDGILYQSYLTYVLSDPKEFEQLLNTV